MVPDNVSNILHELTQLLADDLKPHFISERFEDIALRVSKENLRFEKVVCREYYADHDLALILLMKNEAIENALFEQASKFRLLENELLAEKGNTELTHLKTEDCFFEYLNNCIIFHYNKRKENQRLIANLIEGFNLGHKRLNKVNMIYCS